MAAVPHLDVSERGSEELKQRQEDKGGRTKDRKHNKDIVCSVWTCIPRKTHK